MGNILQDEAYFYLNEYKDIVKTEDGYKLQPVFERIGFAHSRDFSHELANPNT